MSSAIATLVSPLARLWERLNQFLMVRAEREVAAWGSSLQYKRRYTNPEAAINSRKAL